MKKTYLSISIFILVILLSGCNKDKTDNQNAKATISPSPQPVVTTFDEDTSGADEKQEIKTLEVQDYFPIQADTEYVYEGMGNEYASYNVFNDFVDPENNKVQTRTNNGGSETVQVIQIIDGKLSVIYTVHEGYYRDNFMNKVDKKTEVLLMEPLKKGTKWTLSDGRKRYISAVGIDVNTPSGKYKAIEVMTKEKEGTNIDYYAPKVGLVKKVWKSKNMEVSSTLSKIKTNQPFHQTIDVYYPDIDEKIHIKPLKLTFRTGDVTRSVIQKALREQAVKESDIPLISSKTTIKSLYRGADHIAYIDFSKDFVNDMNLGSGFESIVLQCITNTLGKYYDVTKVSITIEGKPYESGHILMKKGETFKVNTDEVVK